MKIGEDEFFQMSCLRAGVLVYDDVRAEEERERVAPPSCRE
jgi:hypothetical protein